MSNRYVLLALIPLRWLLRGLPLTSFLLPLSSLPAQAQRRTYAEVRVGSSMAIGRFWVLGDEAVVEDSQPSVSLQLDWLRTERLSYTAHLRTGNWASRYSSPYNVQGNLDTRGYLLQGGGGLRYADFLYLGPFLEPFVGGQASLAYASYIHRLPPEVRRLTAVVSAEAGLQCWLTGGSALTLTLAAHQLLRPAHKPYSFLVGPYPIPNPQPAYEVRVRPTSRYATLQLGWRWRLPLPRKHWHTPRYSEPPASEED